MSGARSTPELSVVLTGEPHDCALARCFAGFAQQSLPSSQFELLAVGRPIPSTLLPRSIAVHVETDADRTVAAARNRGIDLARADLVLFWDYAWQPDPHLLAWCRQFHERHPSETETARVCAVPHASIRSRPFVRWRIRRGLYPPQPPADGVYAWPHFRCPGLCCRKGLFDLARFNPAYAALDDLHAGARLADRSALTVWFERFPLAAVADPLSFAGGWRSEYLEGFFRHARLMESSWAQTAEDVDDRYLHPERCLRPDSELAALSLTVKQLEDSFGGVDISFVDGHDADRLKLLIDLYETALAHAAARGWLDAGLAKPASPPILPGIA